MPTLFDLAILAVISLAVFFDLEWRRIPNWLIVCGLIAGLGLGGLRGMNALYQGLLGLGMGIGLLIIPFAFRWIGAGDVKFLGVVGAFVGPYLLPRVLWYSALVTGLMAIFTVISRHLSIDFLTRALVDFRQAALVLVTLGRAQSCSANGYTTRNYQGIPWGVGIGLGTLAAYYLDPTGRLAGF